MMFWTMNNRKPDMTTLYGLDTDEEMPQSFLTSHRIWDEYVGQVWAHILALLEMGNDQHVVEIGPGHSVKIASGLSYAGYKGQVTILDALQSVLDVLKPDYQEFLPENTLHFKCGMLHESAAAGELTVDVLLGNHVLDDMLVAAAGEMGALAWSADYRHDIAPDLRAAWAQLEQNEAALLKARQKVHDDIIDFCARANVKRFALSQYPSATLNDHAMKGLNDAAYDVLVMLKESLGRGESGYRLMDQGTMQAALNKNKHYNNAHIGRHVLNAEYWLICHAI
jgi:hypothetical protein